MWDSPLHLFIVLVILAIFSLLFLIPTFRVIQRTGHSGWWCLLSFVPFLNWIGLWVFAYVRWPAPDNATK